MGFLSDIGKSIGKGWDDTVGDTFRWVGNTLDPLVGVPHSEVGGQAPRPPAPPQRSDTTMQTIAQQNMDLERKSRFRTLFAGGNQPGLDTPNISTALLTGF